MQEPNQDGMPIGGLMVFLGTLVTLGLFAFLVGTTDLRIDPRSALDQSVVRARLN